VPSSKEQWTEDRRHRHSLACTKLDDRKRLTRYLISKSRCWEWQGSLNYTGYGIVGIGSRLYGRKTVLAHRLAYQVLVEPIPRGLDVLHKCDNPSCINPSHLFLGTPADNVHDMMSKGRNVVLHGASIGTSKLNEQQVRDIKSKLGYRNSGKLAREFGVSDSLIDNIRYGRSWRHVK